MSTYREIVGKKIKKVSSDPSDGLDGEMWYNSTTGAFSMYVAGSVNAWTAIGGGSGGGGSINDILAFG